MISLLISVFAHACSKPLNPKNKRKQTRQSTNVLTSKLRTNPTEQARQQKKFCWCPLDPFGLDITITNSLEQITISVKLLNGVQYQYF